MLAPTSNDVDDRLIVIPHTEWPQLREMYRRDWPTHIIGCYTLDTFVRWREAAPVANLTVYSLNGEWQVDGLYVCVHRYQVFANTLDDTTPCAWARLQRALQLLPNWSHGYKVSTLCARFRPAVQAIMTQHQFTYDFDSHTKLFHLPYERAAQLDVTPPPGIELRPLRHEHAAQIDAVWPNRHKASEFFIEQIIERSPSVGAFTTNGGELIAWCLRLQAGPHGAMQVDAAHRGRGLGLLVCKALARRLAVELGLDACACVDPDNAASVATFRRAGFAAIADVYWMRNNPSVEVDWTD